MSVVSRQSAWSRVAAVFGFLFKAAVTCFVLATPLLGVWTASSLAAFRGGRIAVAIIAGLVAFPVLPLAWDAASELRRKRRHDDRPRILKFGDRILLRTFALNFALLLGLLSMRPEAAFTALSTRGDWMLDGRRGPGFDRARKLLFRAAQGLEWLYVAAHRNRFEKLVDTRGVKPGTERGGSKSQQRTQLPDRSGERRGTDKATPLEPLVWPVTPTPEPLIANLPPGVESSYQSVASYLLEHAPDPSRRLKALHDWVADRIAYDAVAYARGVYPAQDAETVFTTRKAVCAGYANLFKAMADVTHDDVVVVVGDARTDIADVGGLGHAWNAVKILAKWQLVDVTWDSGTVSGESFEKRYRTAYFLAPPEVFGVDHFPSSDAWQLRMPPITRGDFMRQPMLLPSFYANGFRLERPDRSQVSVPDALDIELDNPRGRYVIASYWLKDAGDMAHGQRCDVEDGPKVIVHCALPTPGVFRVSLFSNSERIGSYEPVGIFEAVRSG